MLLKNTRDTHAEEGAALCNEHYAASIMRRDFFFFMRMSSKTLDRGNNNHG